MISIYLRKQTFEAIICTTKSYVRYSLNKAFNIHFLLKKNEHFGSLKYYSTRMDIGQVLNTGPLST